MPYDRKFPTQFAKYLFNLRGYNRLGLKMGDFRRETPQVMEALRRLPKQVRLVVLRESFTMHGDNIGGLSPRNLTPDNFFFFEDHISLSCDEHARRHGDSMRALLPCNLTPYNFFFFEYHISLLCDKHPEKNGTKKRRFCLRNITGHL